MKKKILIIDDDAELCEELADALAGEGHQVQTACDGVSGLRLAISGKYDVIVLDFKMPGMTGDEVLRAMGTKPDRPKIFFITGRPEIEKFVIDENLSGLVDVVMGKPFDIDIFLEKIKTI
ncbi:MAG: response regulator [Candidatus Omnitrophota bacterium]